MTGGWPGFSRLTPRHLSKLIESENRTAQTLFGYINISSLAVTRSPSLFLWFSFPLRLYAHLLFQFHLHVHCYIYSPHATLPFNTEGGLTAATAPLIFHSTLSNKALDIHNGTSPTSVVASEPTRDTSGSNVAVSGNWRRVHGGAFAHVQ